MVSPSNWKRVALLVYVYGFLKDLRPSGPYLTLFLMEKKNLTLEQVTNQVYPWLTYSHLMWLVPVFLFVDLCPNNALLVVQTTAFVGSWAILLWAKGVPAMKCMQVLYGLSRACEIGYFTYLYSVVSKSHYSKVSGFTRGASLMGKCVGYVLGQVFVSTSLMDLFQLNIFSFTSLSVAFLVTLCLPHSKQTDKTNVPRSESAASIDADSTSENSQTEGVLELTLRSIDDNGINCHSDKSRQGLQCNTAYLRIFHNIKIAMKTMHHNTTSSYANRYVILWSTVSVLSSCGNHQVTKYVQNLWVVIQGDSDNLQSYNGAVEAAGTLLSSLCVVGVGLLPVDWSVRGRCEMLISGISTLKASLLVGMAITDDIWVAYVLYDLFRALYQVVITLQMAEIAKSLLSARYGFVIGCNLFLVLVIETIFMAVVVDEAGLGASVRTQFMMYGVYSGGIAVLFVAMGLFILLRKCPENSNNGDVTENTRNEIFTVSVTGHNIYDHEIAY